MSAVSSLKSPSSLAALRRQPKLLSAVAVLLGLFAAWQLFSTIADARDTLLAQSAQTVEVSVARPLTDGNAPAVAAAVNTLVNAPGSVFNYITVSGPSGQPLASEGAWPDALGWMPASTAAQWRAWEYRVRSAEREQPLMQGAHSQARLRVGVSWLAVLFSCVSALLLWLVVLLASAAGAIFILMSLGHHLGHDRHRETLARWRSHARLPAVASVSPASSAAPVSRRMSVARSAGRQVADLRARLAGLGRSRNGGLAGGFQPIGVHTSTAAVQSEPAKTAAADTASTAAVNDAYSTTGTTVVARGAERTNDSSAAAPLPSPVEAEPAPRRVPSRAVAADSSALGDQTLDLRLFPIWRGMERRILAGAWAALAWRSGEGNLVDAATLTQLAEQDGALRAFTQWIAERFSVLHANWRTLELATVPIVLPIPSALLGFADAERVWRDALARTERDPNDLLLHMTARVADSTPALALPIRRAMTYRDDLRDDLGRDVLFISGQQDPSHGRTAAKALERTQAGLLLGHVQNQDHHRTVIEQKDRVAWFSDLPSAGNLHTPRSFARLLSRCELAPL